MNSGSLQEQRLCRTARVPQDGHTDFGHCPEALHRKFARCARGGSAPRLASVAGCVYAPSGMVCGNSTMKRLVLASAAVAGLTAACSAPYMLTEYSDVAGTKVTVRCGQRYTVFRRPDDDKL